MTESALFDTNELGHNLHPASRRPLRQPTGHIFQDHCAGCTHSVITRNSGHCLAVINSGPLNLNDPSCDLWTRREPGPRPHQEVAG